MHSLKILVYRFGEVQVGLGKTKSDKAKQCRVVCNQAKKMSLRIKMFRLVPSCSGLFRIAPF